MLENWVSSLSNCKSAVLKISNCFLARTQVEEIEDDCGTKGAKAVWEGEAGESLLKVNAPDWKSNIEIGGDTPPSVEYRQQGDRRQISVRNPKDVSFEIDQKTLNRITTAKGACIAAVAGAGVGLLGWLLLAIANRTSLVMEKPEAKSPPLRTSNSNDAGNDLA
ncbi:MAG: hypothetical protein OXN17_14335 [Candidatus Poribacteria bacterium]|nr:hypothetical protein [Candidatus Poribacteria bacterium]MDE0506887.1 hypothetical protein [Candidatus Poribacteria bacterium]